LPDGTLCAPNTPFNPQNPTGSGSVPLGAPCSLFDFDQQGRLIFGFGDLGRNMGATRPYTSVDLRLTRAIRFSERVRLDVIAEAFNLLNRFNEGAASPSLDAVRDTGFERVKSGRYRSRSTAAFDARQFQFGLKLNF
jgi:hypothetical protein